MKKNRKVRRNKNKIMLTVALFLVIVASVTVWNLSQTRFGKNTFINGINCSWLTVKEAESKILKENLEGLSFSISMPVGENAMLFPTKEQAKSFVVRASLSTEKKQVDSDNVKIPVTYEVNEEKLRSFFEKEIDKSEVFSRNAYVAVKGEKAEIISEKYGYKADLDQMVKISAESIKNGQFNIDLTDVMKVTPQILSDDKGLLQNKKEIQNLLDTVVEYQISEGNTITLDKNTVKNWLYTDMSTGMLEITSGKLEEFVELLSKAVQKTEGAMMFQSTDSAIVSVPVKNIELQLNEDAEIKRLNEVLFTGESYTFAPIYKSENVADFTESYIELDIGRQKLWLYRDNEVILESDCVTGNVSKGNDTPTGLYFLTSKARNRTLTDNRTYWSFVKYWMPFNRGIGFHDASWRNEFGGDIYLTNGSHGCVNLPREAAEILYKNISPNIPIIIYNSNLNLGLG